MARGRPHGGRAEDGGVEADDVVAQLHHGAPPGVLDVAQHVDPERAVVVGGAEAAVDLGRGEDEAAGAAQPHHLLHQVVGARPRAPRLSRSSVQDTGADSGADLVGQQPAPHREHGPAVDVGRRGPPAPRGAPGSPTARPAACAATSDSASNARCSGVELLAARLGRAPGLDGVDVALGRTHVPPARAGAVRVRGRADADVVALLPVEVVVPALVPGPGPVGDLLPVVAGRA